MYRYTEAEVAAQRAHEHSRREMSRAAVAEEARIRAEENAAAAEAMAACEVGAVQVELSFP